MNRFRFRFAILGKECLLSPLPMPCRDASPVQEEAGDTRLGGRWRRGAPRARRHRGHEQSPLVCFPRKVQPTDPGLCPIKGAAVKRCSLDCAVRAHSRPARVFGAGPPTLRYVDLGFLACCAKFIPFLTFCRIHLRDPARTPNQTTICINSPAKCSESASAA